jgi:hypothetical protein
MGFLSEAQPPPTCCCARVSCYDDPACGSSIGSDDSDQHVGTLQGIIDDFAKINSEGNIVYIPEYRLLPYLCTSRSKIRPVASESVRRYEIVIFGIRRATKISPMLANPKQILHVESPNITFGALLTNQPPFLSSTAHFRPAGLLQIRRLPISPTTSS